MTRAPELPTTEQLHLAYDLEPQARDSIKIARVAFSGVLNDPESGFMDVEGPCGITIAERRIILGEAPEVMQMEKGRPGYHAAYRVNPYKPRTNKTAWHGAETTHPEEAFEIITELANMRVNNVMEVAHPYHIARYGRLLVAAWVGSRNEGDEELIDLLTMQDIKLPLGIKNGLSGDINTALRHVERTNTMRRELAEKLGVIAAPTVLIYRGGENARTPEEWEEAYIEAYEATEGRLIVDTAHGTEMAHHPDGIFEKSIQGQIDAQDHLIELAERGYAPPSRFAESSNAEGETDPPVPLKVSLANGVKLYDIKMQSSTLARAA